MHIYVNMYLGAIRAINAPCPLSPPPPEPWKVSICSPDTYERALDTSVRYFIATVFKEFLSFSFFPFFSLHNKTVFEAGKATLVSPLSDPAEGRQNEFNMARLSSIDSPDPFFKRMNKLKASNVLVREYFVKKVWQPMPIKKGTNFHLRKWWKHIWIISYSWWRGKDVGFRHSTQ